MASAAEAWVVIPAYNEESIVGSTVTDVLREFANIVVVDDGSSDRTGEQSLAAGAAVCRHPVNLGQGAALATGIEFALSCGAKAIVTFDADGQHAVRDAVSMLETLSVEGVDVVLGSRFLGQAHEMSCSRRLFLRGAAFFTRLTTGLAVTDAHNGLRVLGAQAASSIRLRQNRMAHASELMHQIAELRLSYREVPCTITYTEYSISKGQRLSGAFAILIDLLIGRMHR